jgi:hypothetical protein
MFLVRWEDVVRVEHDRVVLRDDCTRLDPTIPETHRSR